MYQDLAQQILARPPRLGRTRLVAVDGPSGSGKTTFAERLARAFPFEVPVVHTDDFLDGWADQFTFWPRLERWLLTPLRSGRPGRYRRYDWLRGEFVGPWIEVTPVPVVILEGVSAARAEIRPELSLSVFVTAPAAVRRARALARDGMELLPYLQKWWQGEDRHFTVDATADHVDLVVSGERLYEMDDAGELRHDQG